MFTFSDNVPDGGGVGVELGVGVGVALGVGVGVGVDVPPLPEIVTELILNELIAEFVELFIVKLLVPLAGICAQLQ